MLALEIPVGPWPEGETVVDPGAKSCCKGGDLGKITEGQVLRRVRKEFQVLQDKDQGWLQGEGRVVDPGLRFAAQRGGAGQQRWTLE